MGQPKAHTRSPPDSLCESQELSADTLCVRSVGEAQEAPLPLHLLCCTCQVQVHHPLSEMYSGSEAGSYQPPGTI